MVLLGLNFVIKKISNNFDKLAVAKDETVELFKHKELISEDLLKITKKFTRRISSPLFLHHQEFPKENIETHFALLKRTGKKDRVELFRVSSGEKKTNNALKREEKNNIAAEEIDSWTKKDDNKLIALYKKNIPEIALSKIFKKEISEIRSRILKLTIH